MKKFISVILCVVLVFSFAVPAFASSRSSSTLTEAEVMRQIANNTATVTYEARTLDSFTQEEIEQRPDLQKIFDELNKPEPYSINHVTNYGRLYSTTIVTEAGQKVIYSSYPKVTFHVVDVGTAGSSDIYCELKIIESVDVDGDLNSGWENAIRYKNITGTMGCGVNTAFTEDVRLTGDSSGTFAPSIKGIIGFIISLADLDTLSKIMSVFDTFTYSGGQVSTQNITSTYVRAVGSDMPNELLFRNGKNLTIHSSVSTIDSTKTANQTAIAAAKWTYDVYFFAGSLSPKYSNEIVSINTEYLVNAK